MNMLEASSTGSAPLRQKTINAEVNLLSEWLRRRSRLNEHIARMAGILGLILVVGGGSMPFFIRAYGDAHRRSIAALDNLEMAKAKLASLQPARTSARPRIDQSVMRDTVKREAEQFIGHTVLLLNSASAGMAFDVISADVIGGEMVVHVRADAENNSVIQGFYEQAQKGPNVQSTLLATSSHNGILGAEGMGFEYIKRIKVTP
jgi:hypothetical protein